MFFSKNIVNYKVAHLFEYCNKTTNKESPKASTYFTSMDCNISKPNKRASFGLIVDAKVVQQLNVYANTWGPSLQADPSK